MSEESGLAFGGERFTRPVRASQLFDTPEMGFRYPAEIELRRNGTDEGEGRGFDNMDLSAAAERTISASDAAATVVSWFVDALTFLGWTDQGDGWLRRDEGESFFARIERDRGSSRIGSLLTDSDARRMQEEFEEAFYAGAPRGWSVVTLFYTVAPLLGPTRS